MWFDVRPSIPAAGSQCGYNNHGDRVLNQRILFLGRLLLEIPDHWTTATGGSRHLGAASLKLGLLGHFNQSLAREMRLVRPGRLRLGHDHRRMAQWTLDLLPAPGVICLHGLFATGAIKNDFSHKILQSLPALSLV